MFHYPQLLLIGGTGRNVGKTEFTCRMIARFAAEQKIYALKVSAMYPDEQIYHGEHEHNPGDFFLFEEHRRNSGKDTARMLRAGAQRVFYLQCEGLHILKGFKKFIQNVPAGTPVVCESNSLGVHVQPGLSVMVTSPEVDVKERAKMQLANADLIIESDGRSGFPEIEKFQYLNDRGWHLDQAGH